MPLRVTIEVVPGGDETRAEVLDVVTITNVGPTSKEQAKDPGGGRIYRVIHSGHHTVAVTHMRSYGAMWLAGSSLLTLAGQINGKRSPADPNQEELAL